MTPTEIAIYAQIFVTAVCAIAYVMTYRYQSNKLATMEKTVKNMTDLISGQSQIIADFDRYKSIFSIEDFEKRLALKLDNKEMEMNKHFENNVKGIYEETIKSAADVFQTENAKILNGWAELSEIAIGVTIKKYPKKEDKEKRDQFIKKSYPRNADYFIGFMDDYIDGKIKVDNHSQ